MNSTLESTLAKLSEIQRRAVYWDKGPLLVLAGPGSGKTRVLTCRIARLLDKYRDQRFRILALTFTNKAADEMANRVAAFVPELEGRANIRTIHGFCLQVLRQHGVHLGIKPDFEIYSQTKDRQAVLEDALRRDQMRDTSSEEMRLLPLIDDLKVQLVGVEQAEQHVGASKWGATVDPCFVARAYRLYENELRRVNALDYNSLIFEAHRLFAYPAIARLYQTAYRYWLIDEFQDTNGAQYSLFRRMAAGGFHEIFAVADDDQTIFEWNGANVRRISHLVNDFSSEVVQLPTNFRCPPVIVEAANRLIVYNSARVRSKQFTGAVTSNSPLPDGAQIQYREFGTDLEEMAGIADEIGRQDPESRSQTAVLARNHAILDAIHEGLKSRSLPSVILRRREDFVSPQMHWLVACLKQIQRPLDEHNMGILVDSFESFAGMSMELSSLVSRSETEGVTCLSLWVDTVREAGIPSPGPELVDMIAKLSAGSVGLSTAINRILACFEKEPDDDLKEDLSAWRRISSEIRDSRSHASLEQFLQELNLRSKEPVPDPKAVTLMTIDGAKGREFDTVYLIGLAEEILPSWHSVKKGDRSAEIEEERRRCFVAITRTRKRLILSRAQQYRGWPKDPSRFLEEMGCLDESVPGQAGDGTG